MAMIAARAVAPDAETETLHVTWADGHESAIPYLTLRDLCPCARCRDDRDNGRTPLRMALTTKLLKWSQLGNYAINFEWADSHSDGIFAYDYLRGLCPCGTCEPVRR
jgi:ATP-binding protein involved in chromosome partitioning